MAGARDPINVESLQMQARSVSWQPVEVKLEIAGACCVSSQLLRASQLTGSRGSRTAHVGIPDRSWALMCKMIVAKETRM